MTQHTHTCRSCGVPFEINVTGRPAVFCSIGCRRAAEYKCRRLQDRLTRLENEAEACRRDRTGLHDALGAGPQERAADIAREIEAAETELRLLLGGLADSEGQTRATG